LISFIAGGCASKDTIIPVPDQDMKAVYDQHMGASGEGKILDRRSLLRRPIVEPDVNLSNYVRTESTQLQSRFRLIPNPTMYMFVAPHLAGNSGVPIPGYLTEFKMWEKDNYALPGEVSDMEPLFENGERR
tara:strand:+ start:41391 stop:41783 length:393 start_codon:yes stop_codon:yes gene_type:complete